MGLARIFLDPATYRLQIPLKRHTEARLENALFRNDLKPVHEEDEK
jgi:hypothetical protein